MITKFDLCWVVVRLAGAVLILCSAIQIFGAVINWWELRAVLLEFTDLSRDTTMANLRSVLFNFLPPLVFGIYLLRFGTGAHRLLMAVPSSSTPEPAIDEEKLPGINLSGADLKAFKEWINNTPEAQKRSPIDQVALFRDAQAR